CARTRFGSSPTARLFSLPSYGSCFTSGKTGASGSPSTETASGCRLFAAHTPWQRSWARSPATRACRSTSTTRSRRRWPTRWRRSTSRPSTG
ncbi:MAG: hypothetical protein AVDCRST_MAG59-3901, partial [uncultured Thermomicrobiales bacterium]